jgi:integrase/recombinase XerD
MPKTTEMRIVPELNYVSFLADAMRDYLDYLDALGFSTVMPIYRLRRIDRFLVEHRICHFAQINNQLMIQFVDECKGRVGAKTLGLYRYAFHGLCRYLIRQGWLTENPVASFPVPNPQPYRPHVFSPQELHLFFDFLKERMKHAADPVNGFHALSHYTFYHLLYACGLRVSEAIALNRSLYSPEHATLYIQRSKFLKDRLIPISRKVCSNLDYLLERRKKIFKIPPEGSLFLFLPDARPYNRKWASTYFRKILRHLRIYHGKEYHRGVCCGTPHLHELRRAFAVHRLLRWYREKADVNAKLPLLATYMGHSHFKHTKTYLTLTEQLLSEAGSRFAANFDRLDWVPDDPKLR